MFPNTNFPGAKKYWHMGKFYDWSEAHYHPMNHALHYGTSTFEGIRAYKTPRGTAIFRLPEHIDRFLHSASVLRMTPPYPREEMIETVRLVVRENGLESAYIRPLMFYGYGNLGLIPKACPVELLMAAWEWGAYLGEKTEKGVSAYILSKRRVHHSQLDMRAKLGGVYVQSTMYGMEARAEGYDEAIFLNLEGNVAEGPGENLFIVKDGVVRTNDRTESILEGITRTSILEIARDLGYPTAVGPITKPDLFTADESFFSGTAVEITPVILVADGSDPKAPKTEHAIGTGKLGSVTKRLREAFSGIVRGAEPRYEKWLTYVK
jgi:branched-chain amino acid aminotransferase